MKRYVKRLLLRTRIPQAVASIGRRRAAILRYHSIQAVPADHATTIGVGIIHSEAVFNQQMEIVARRFNPVTMDDIVFWLKGRYALPRRAVAITFDDGFADNYEVAAPILARYGLRAAFYVTVSSIVSRRAPWFCRLRSAFHATPVPRWTDETSGQTLDIRHDQGRRDGFLAACRTCAVLTGQGQEEYVRRVELSLGQADAPNGSSLMMNWDQVSALRKMGHIIGSHTMTHPNMAHVRRDDAIFELQESKRVLEQQLAAPIEHFSYPSPILEPHCSAETTGLVEEAGYLSATTCLPGAVGSHHEQFRLPRVSVPAHIDEFLWTLEASLAGRVL